MPAAAVPPTDSSPSLPPLAKACAICGTPLTLLDAPTSPTCRAQRCRWTYQSAPRESRCSVCGRLLTAEQRAERLCAAAECRSARLSEVVAEGARQSVIRQRAQEELDRQAHALRAESAAALGVDDAESFPIVITPSFWDAFNARRLPERRRRALRAHVERIVDAALAARETAAPPAPTRAPETSPDVAPEIAPEIAPAVVPEVAAALGTVLGQACATCQGFCCHRGGEEAYLTVATVSRFMDAHPALGRDAVVEAYAARAGGTTYEQSCVFHRRTGCALPREMRSDTCNDFLCGPLVELQRAVLGAGPDAPPPRAFFAATNDGQIEAAAFVDARAVRVARRRALPIAPDAAIA